MDNTTNTTAMETVTAVRCYGTEGIEGVLGTEAADVLNDLLGDPDEGHSFALGGHHCLIGDLEEILEERTGLPPPHRRVLEDTIALMNRAGAVLLFN